MNSNITTGKAPSTWKLQYPSKKFMGQRGKSQGKLEKFKLNKMFLSFYGKDWCRVGVIISLNIWSYS